MDKKTALQSLVYINQMIGECYLVGGAVRHIIDTSIKIDDLDFCTPLLPDKVIEKAIDANIDYNDEYKLFGKITLKLFSGNIPCEITTFRIDKYFDGSRYPEVTFIDNLETDLLRRDFTINAIAYSHKNEIIDPLQGLSDLNKKTLKFIADPITKISEDPIRILRLIKYTLKLNFIVEDKSKKACVQEIYQIKKLTKRQIEKEIKSILALKVPMKLVIDKFKEYNLFRAYYGIEIEYNESTIKIIDSNKSNFDKYREILNLYQL